jgi:hypothetical protein
MSNALNFSFSLSSHLPQMAELYGKTCGITSQSIIDGKYMDLREAIVMGQDKGLVAFPKISPDLMVGYMRYSVNHGGISIREFYTLPLYDRFVACSVLNEFCDELINRNLRMLNISQEHLRLRNAHTLFLSKKDEIICPYTVAMGEFNSLEYTI